MHNYACTSSCFLFIFLDYGVLGVNNSSFVVHIQDKMSHLVVHYIITQSLNSIKTIMSYKKTVNSGKARFFGASSCP